MKDNLTVTFTSPTVPVFTAFHDSGRVIDSKISFSSFLSKYYGISIQRDATQTECVLCDAVDVFLKTFDHSTVALTDRTELEDIVYLREVLLISEKESMRLSFERLPESIEAWSLNLHVWACKVRAILLSMYPVTKSSGSVHIDLNGVFLP